MKMMSLLLLAGFTLALAQTPVFLPATYIYAGSSPIDVTWYGSPFYYDWDGDGVKDLVTGQYTSGYVRFYKNIGTDTNPQFGSTFEYLSADGSLISVFAS